jgi:hypothetical protein
VGVFKRVQLLLLGRRARYATRRLGGAWRSPARRHGRRRARRPRAAYEHACACGSFTQGRSWRPRIWWPSPWRSRARLARPRQGRGDAGALEGGGEDRHKRAGSKARPCPRLGLRVCWGAPGRKGVAARTVPCASANAATAWRRGHERTTRHTTATRTNELASERASMKAAAPARKHPSLARRPASPAAARRRGATTRSTSARRPGHPHGAGSDCPHLGGHGPKCRRVGEERRGGWDGEEEEEAGGGAASRRKRKQRMQAFTVGPAPPSGGSGFAANGFPAGGSFPHSLLPLHFSSGGRRGTAGAPPLGWLGFRGFRPVRRWSLYRAARRGHVGSPDAPGRAARRDGGGAAGAPPPPSPCLWASAKG